MSDEEKGALPEDDPIVPRLPAGPDARRRRWDAMAPSVPPTPDETPSPAERLAPPGEPASTDPASRSGRNLPVAIGTGVLLATTFIGSVFIAPLLFTVFVAVCVAVAVVETSATLRGIGIPVAVPAVLAGALLAVFGAYEAGHAGQVVGLLVLFFGTLVWLLADPDRDRVVVTVSTSMLLGLWIGFLGSFAALLVGSTDGSAATLLVIGSAVFGDIGGYAVGSWIGRTPVAPRISPNKTWEGLAGGLVTAAVVAGLVIPPLSEGFDVATAAAVGAVCGLAGFAGDLIESMVKRDLGLKDLGSIIPGHGGVMDRLDGVLVALPIGFYTVMLLR